MHIVAIGGSDAGISAALRARELDPSVDVTVVVADAYPNYSICGIPYYFSGDVQPWQSLAHRTHADLEATGMRLRLDTLATRIDVAGRQLTVQDEHGESVIDYDELIVGTGALPAYAGIAGLDQLGPDDGVHVIHSMGDTFALDTHLTERDPRTAIIIGAGYVGLEMAEGFTARGIQVTQLQRGPEVLSTLDPELAVLVHAELVEHGVAVHTNTTVRAVEKTATGLTVRAERDGQPVTYTADLVLAVVGVRPNTSLLEQAGATLGAGKAVVVDEQMRTGVPHVFAAGDGVVTHHRLLGVTYLPLVRQLTSRAVSRGRTRWADQPDSPAPLALRSSRSSTSSPPAPAFAITRRPPPDTQPRARRPSRTTTSATTRERSRSASASPATPTPAFSWALNWSADSAPRLRNASTPMRRPCSPA